MCLRMRESYLESYRKMAAHAKWGEIALEVLFFLTERTFALAFGGIISHNAIITCSVIK